MIKIEEIHKMIDKYEDRMNDLMLGSIRSGCRPPEGFELMVRNEIKLMREDIDTKEIYSKTNLLIIKYIMEKYEWMEESIKRLKEK